jgi:hypothetical protein
VPGVLGALVHWCAFCNSVLEYFESSVVHRQLIASSKIRAFHASKMHSNGSLTPTDAW